MTTSTTLFRKLPKPWKPHAYQKSDVKSLISNNGLILVNDPGLGKTSITLAALKILLQKKIATKILIIAPLRACYAVWPLEVTKWSDFKHLRISILHGPKKDEALQADADIYVINPEGLEWLTKPVKTKSSTGRVVAQPDMRRWKQLGFDTLVVDELTCFKNSSSVRFKIMKPLIPTFDRRWGLTGSLMASGYENLFGQCYIIDHGRAFGPYVTHFRNRYFNQGYDGYSWELKHGAEELIQERLKDLIVRRKAEDFIDMPMVVNNVIKIQLPTNAMDFYDNIHDEMVAKIEGKTIIASNAGVATGKCRQIASGAIYLEPDLEITGFKLPKVKREWLELHDEKIKALLQLIEELQGSPLLVAYYFEHDLERIQTALGGNVPYIGKGVPAKKSKELVDQWNAGKIPVLLGSPQSMGHALNMQQSGNHVCWFSLTWDFEIYDQFVRRIRRQGSTHKRVFVHHLVAEDTVDEIMYEVLHKKDKQQSTFFDELKKLRRRRK